MSGLALQSANGSIGSKLDVTWRLDRPVRPNLPIKPAGYSKIKDDFVSNDYQKHSLSAAKSLKIVNIIISVRWLAQNVAGGQVNFGRL
jgi:hypothetical protein